MLPTCSSCRRRPAVYLRRASGHPLCLACLEEALFRAFKRSVRGLDAFKPGVAVGVYISALDPVSGVALAYIAGLVERDYGGRAVALRPGYVKLGGGSLALLEKGEDLPHPLGFVPLEITPQPFAVNPIMIQQDTGPSGILAQDQVHLFEDLYGAEGDVLQIPDGGPYHIESPCHGTFSLRTRMYSPIPRPRASFVPFTQTVR